MLRDGEFDDSIDFLLQALVETPTDTEIHVFLAYAYSKLDEVDKAVEILEQAVSIAPDSAKIHYNLGVAYHKMHNLTQAKDEYTRAVSLAPSYTAALKALEGISTPTNGGPDPGAAEA